MVARGHAQRAAGAAILDVGGESTRPGATPVPEDVELARVIPAVERLAVAGDVLVSVDTSKPAVAEAALRAGARVVNDVSGLQDERLAEVAARHGAWLVVTDNGWTQPRERAGNIVDDVCAELRRLVEVARRAGVARERIVVDPGLGFGKTAEETLALVAATAEIRERLVPHLLLSGPSRKSFIGRALGLDDPRERLEGTLAAVAIAAFLGADVVRVHDVREADRAARLAAAAASARGEGRLAYVGLGSNVGDRRAALHSAVAALGRIGRVASVSGLWETAPVEVTEQPRFLNAVVALWSRLPSAADIVARLKLLEEVLGRRPGRRYGPRVIDLDVLAFGDGAEERDGDVAVPHAHLAERRFALAPLAELAPDLVVTPSLRTVRDLLAAVAGQDARRVEDTPLEHHRRHPRSFLDVSDDPARPGMVTHLWCLECDYDVQLSEEDAERLADQGVPWRTGTE